MLARLPGTLKMNRMNWADVFQLTIDIDDHPSSHLPGNDLTGLFRQFFQTGDVADLAQRIGGKVFDQPPHVSMRLCDECQVLICAYG